MMIHASRPRISEEPTTEPISGNPAGFGPGDVVEDGAHRAIATFRSTVLARMPSGTVISR